MTEIATSPCELSCDEVWRTISKGSFLVLSFVNARGEPRSSGVVYATVRRHLYVVVQPDGCKARNIKDGQVVSVTVPVRKGGILSFLMPIPPATVSFHARAIVHAPGTLDPKSAAEFAPHHPEIARRTGCIIELVPEGQFLTYGIGVPLTSFRDPEAALRHAPTS
jgi:hypothetical protein